MIIKYFHKSQLQHQSFLIDFMALLNAVSNFSGREIVSRKAAAHPISPFLSI